MRIQILCQSYELKCIIRLQITNVTKIIEIISIKSTKCIKHGKFCMKDPFKRMEHITPTHKILQVP